MILNITRSKDTRYARGGGKTVIAHAGDEVTVFHLYLAGKHIGIGFVANGDEDATQFFIFGAAISGLDAYAGHAGVVTQYFIQG